MNGFGKERLHLELEKFVITRLKSYWHKDKELEYMGQNAEEQLKYLNSVWAQMVHVEEKDMGLFIKFPQLTNHEICHEMFWNAFRGFSRMYIQIPNFNSEENSFSKFLDGDAEVFTLSCSLLTLQMLDYDIMMFRAMEDRQDEEYRDAAIKHYRPYLFNYVAEIDKKMFKKLKELQRNEYSNKSENNLSDYIWLECTFNPDSHTQHLNLNGYVVQSASNIDKIKQKISIIESSGSDVKLKKMTLDVYKLKTTCMNDNDFSHELEIELNALDSLSSIYVYRIGNGNCIYAENKQKDNGFFFDIGFNYKHRPKKLSSNSTYNYSSTMKEIFKKKPNFFILSHWDLDHIAGSFAASKGFLDKKWFAPDCYDAGIDATRLAKYLDMKGNLFRVKRKNTPGRRIGKISVGSNVTYKLFMGEKASCDRSHPNCEGIVIKYKDTDKTVLMMGDVNYKSFNKAIQNHNLKKCSAASREPLFADTKIDYLVVPHHGSEHTDYNLITGSKPVNDKKKAIICCTNLTNDNRPNKGHKNKLEERFEVYTTESDANKNNYIEIPF